MTTANSTKSLKTRNKKEYFLAFASPSAPLMLPQIRSPAHIWDLLYEQQSLGITFTGFSANLQAADLERSLEGSGGSGEPRIAQNQPLPAQVEQQHLHRCSVLVYKHIVPCSAWPGDQIPVSWRQRRTRRNPLEMSSASCLRLCVPRSAYFRYFSDLPSLGRCHLE